MGRKIIEIVLLVILLILVACKEEKSKIKKTSNANNNVELLSEIVSTNPNLKISYHLPINWEKMSVAKSIKIVGRLTEQGQNRFVVYIPHSFYYDSETKSLLRIGEVKFKESSEVLSIATYLKLFKKYNSSSFSIEIIDIDGALPTFQIKSQKNNLLTFKYLFTNKANNIIELDYSIEDKNLAEEYPKIMASVRSVKLF